jgi:D-threo-aldose 1-dehydrogenase
MIRLPRTGLGTAPLGGLFKPVDNETAEETLELAWERGIRFFDTAPLYGRGLSEQRLGRFFADKPRDEFVLATKVGRLLRADAPAMPLEEIWKNPSPFNPVFDFSYDAVLRSIDESLERLGLDRLDIVHIHDPDDHYDEAIGGAYPALDRLRSEGAIGAVGAGMNQVEMLLRFAREADFDCFLVAGRYTALDRVALPELLPLCVERDIAVIIGGAFNSGLLAGGTTFNYAPAPPELVARVAELDALCARHGVPLAAVALQFPLRHPAVASVLLGPRSPKQLAENLDLLDVTIPAELWDEL